MRRYRDGRIAAQGEPVRARSVEDVARQVARTFVELGARDPRLNVFGRLDVRLSGLIRQWKQQDLPPLRVKPVPISLLHYAHRVASSVHNAQHDCLADMLWVAFFFLCRPGEFTAGTDSARPFRFCDVQLWLGPRRLDLRSADDALLLQASLSSLTFTNQKNCVPGEVIAIGTSGSAVACATRAIGRRVYLRSCGAPENTPLCAFQHAGRWYTVTNAMVTRILRVAAVALGPQLGLVPKKISAQSLRHSGALAMLCGGIDPSVGRLWGRWRSDIMFRYLSVQAAPLVANVASLMFAGGNFELVPGPNVPDLAADLGGRQLPAVPGARAPALREDPPANLADMVAAVAAANPNEP